GVVDADSVNAELEFLRVGGMSRQVVLAPGRLVGPVGTGEGGAYDAGVGEAIYEFAIQYSILRVFLRVGLTKLDEAVASGAGSAGGGEDRDRAVLDGGEVQKGCRRKVLDLGGVGHDAAG